MSDGANFKHIGLTAGLLMMFAIVGALIVSASYVGTRDRILENERQALLRNLNAIIPAGEYDNDLVSSVLTLSPANKLAQTEESQAYRAMKNGEVSAIVFRVTAPNGYSGAIKLLIGVYRDGRVAGVRVVAHKETPGLGDAIEIERSDWLLGFDGKSLGDPDSKHWKVKRDGGVFDQFTGATITPRAVVQAVHNTLLYFNSHRESLLNVNIPDDEGS